ncbi:integration host factor subunit alpha [Gluconobacter cerinus]|uniref:integration host factor subunit alpha n=1 Tax=Gluconobacter TaxID=441 RepID=UPI00062C9469|nr:MULTISPECIES: integration host factor subunit alpha [Gluconobacter]MBM3096534.1 integration host factor subunit alpha [Gluconobacter cerinus]MBS0982620.1 integration host factor subunit alpha [Gluconobacter cerinus]
MSTVTRANLVEHIYSRVGLSRHDSSMILESVLEKISSTLEAGESVKLSGFGTFSVRQKGERIGRNPKTGVEVPILPRAVLVFRSSQLLRDQMNGVESHAGDVDDADD